MTLWVIHHKTTCQKDVLYLVELSFEKATFSFRAKRLQHVFSEHIFHPTFHSHFEEVDLQCCIIELSCHLASGEQQEMKKNMRARCCLYVLTCPWEFPMTPWRTIPPEVFAWSFLPLKIGNKMMLVTRNSCSVQTVIFQFSRERLNFFLTFHICWNLHSVYVKILVF